MYPVCTKTSIVLIFLKIYYFVGNYWDNVNNRRDFFCRIGKHLGFNPLIPENWYAVSPTEINKFKV